jgi:predicted 3-demethylubiquinone-9 3-methyltransferase (glyoxalase superfamily)
MPLAQPITPHLWFDTQAEEAATFYCSVFPDAGIDAAVRLRGTPSGDCDVLQFHLCGQPFMAISAGPHFTFNPSISFFVNFDPSRDAHAREHLDALWDALVDGGQALMPLDEYPFSKRFGWVQDRYGLSWQLILSRPEGDPRPMIVPSLLFTGAVCGRAKEAGTFYRSVFDDSREGTFVPYPAGAELDREGTVMFSDFRLGDTWFAAMDSAYPHGFGFNEAISFLVPCRDQAEIDRYWAALSSVPEAERCGWCKDRFGVSWQISPIAMHDILASGDQAAIERVTRAFMPMRKLDLARLEAAAAGK